MPSVAAVGHLPPFPTVVELPSIHDEKRGRSCESAMEMQRGIGKQDAAGPVLMPREELVKVRTEVDSSRQ